MLKNKFLTFSVATIAYILVVLYYPFTIAPHMSILIKAYDFVIGMFLVLIWRKDRRRLLFVTIPVLLIWIFYPEELPVNPTFSLTIFSTAFFLSFSRMESLLEKCSWKRVDQVCRYSYIHGVKEIVLLSVAELVMIFVATIILHKLVVLILDGKQFSTKK